MSELEQMRIKIAILERRVNSQNNVIEKSLNMIARLIGTIDTQTIQFEDLAFKLNNRFDVRGEIPNVPPTTKPNN